MLFEFGMAKIVSQPAKEFVFKSAFVIPRCEAVKFAADPGRKAIKALVGFSRVELD
jgi:hypothetical protein